jgi:ERCC4-type nuclease
MTVAIHFFFLFSKLHFISAKHSTFKKWRDQILAHFPETPVIMEYRLTDHGKSIKDLIQQIIEWGLKHREVVITDE